MTGYAAFAVHNRKKNEILVYHKTGSSPWELPVLSFSDIAGDAAQYFYNECNRFRASVCPRLAARRYHSHAFSLPEA